jgi:hypothetical protein
MGLHIFDVFSTLHLLITKSTRINTKGMSRFRTVVRSGVKTSQRGFLKTREYCIPKHSVFVSKTLINLQPVIVKVKQQLPILNRWFSGIYLACHTSLSCLSCTIEEYDYIPIAEIKTDPVHMIEPTDRPPPAIWYLVLRLWSAIFPEIRSSSRRNGKWSMAVSESEMF